MAPAVSAVPAVPVLPGASPARRTGRAAIDVSVNAGRMAPMPTTLWSVRWRTFCAELLAVAERTQAIAKILDVRLF